MVEWFARLAKDGERVLCARRECGRELARAEQRHLGRFLEFPPGWVQGEDGVWHLSRHARQRIESGRTPAYRRLRRKVARMLPGDAIAHIPRAASPQTYPAQAQCPYCALIQTLDDRALGVVIERHQRPITPVYPDDISRMLREIWDAGKEDDPRVAEVNDDIQRLRKADHEEQIRLIRKTEVQRIKLRAVLAEAPAAPNDPARAAFGEGLRAAVAEACAVCDDDSRDE